MKNAGMAKHTISAFNEKTAIRMLSDFLEQNHTIATFFKENDRTPNYDGSFELVDEDETPTKQFIVQIKKIENLVPNIKGLNKGKYVYDMDTSFLYYVKEKVTESPAIYFVVDIVTKNIFWLYLSDELLMGLDFEGKERISYPFEETDIVPNIEVFVQILSQIASKRNALFLQKTPEQIEEMQDALDYINRLMENDFCKIKEVVFPNLWRFGIKYTPGETMSITAGDQTITSEAASMFALYPQMKGIADTGLKEYTCGRTNYFNHFDMFGKITPMEYVRNSLQKVIKSYFEDDIPATQLPDIMLFERLNSFVQRMGRFYEFKIDDGKILISDLYRGYILLIRYIQHIILDQCVDPDEEDVKADITNRFNRGDRNYFDILHCGSKVVSCFKKFCLQNENNERIGFKPDLMFQVIPKYQIASFVDIAELKQRETKYYEQVWEYDYFELSKLSPTEIMAKTNEICTKWFSELPVIYDNLFESLFEKSKYRFKGKFEYCNEFCRNEHYGPWFSTVVREYRSNTFSVIYNPECNDSFTDEDREKGLLYIHSGILVSRFLQRKSLFYDSVRCLLYQGICKELGYECKGLSIGGMRFELF